LAVSTRACVQSIHLFIVCIPYGIVENVINPGEFMLHPGWSFPHFPEEEGAGARGGGETVARKTS
jgi:hypothetical protein